MKTQSFASVSTKQARMAEQARACPELVFTALHHHIDLEWMRMAWSLTRRDGATGVDGVKADGHEKELEASLTALLNRIRSGSHHAPPVRRHCIPEADGKRRPPGMPALEDKVAQWAIVMVLEPIARRTSCPARMASGPDAPPTARSAACGTDWPWRACDG